MYSRPQTKVFRIPDEKPCDCLDQDASFHRQHTATYNLSGFKCEPALNAVKTTSPKGPPGTLAGFLVEDVVTSTPEV